MGIYDRDYYRPQQSSPSNSSYRPRSIVISLIVVNVAVWIIDAFTPGVYAETLKGPVLVGHWLSDHLAVHVSTLTSPWLWWQYVTYGFTHSPNNFGHILGNMFVLFILGRGVEERYGSKEFLRVYLVMVVFAALAWTIVNKISGTPALQGAYGASGAIAGVVVLYAFNFPHRTLLLFFVIPMPAWLLGALVVIWDIFGAMKGGGGIAYSMHLAGAAFALIYYKQQWSISRLTDFRFGRLKSIFQRKPRLKIHDPKKPADSDMSEEVDRILAKLHSNGEAGLTSKERRTLENASREYQKRRKD